MGKAVVSILNMKGGVGKTTVAAHVFRVLYHRHEKKTLLIDLDPQFNLTQCIMTRNVYDTLVAENKTILRAFEPLAANDFFSIKTTVEAPPDTADIVRSLRHFPATR